MSHINILLKRTIRSFFAECAPSPIHVPEMQIDCALLGIVTYRSNKVDVIPSHVKLFRQHTHTHTARLVNIFTAFPLGFDVSFVRCRTIEALNLQRVRRNSIRFVINFFLCLCAGVFFQEKELQIDFFALFTYLLLGILCRFIFWFFFCVILTFKFVFVASANQRVSLTWWTTLDEEKFGMLAPPDSCLWHFLTKLQRQRQMAVGRTEGKFISICFCLHFTLVSVAGFRALQWLQWREYIF